ncbi:MAG: hypothetical protein M3O34_10930 [Chloroflexota bacterium]|nr:hypothetical protein [Chloroflexota bacterium]
MKAWSARSYGAASGGEAFSPYLRVGAGYNALLALPLLGRFRRRSP